MLGCAALIDTTSVVRPSQHIPRARFVRSFSNENEEVQRKAAQLPTVSDCDEDSDGDKEESRLYQKLLDESRRPSRLPYVILLGLL